MDKVAAANRINEFLQAVVNLGGLHLKYRIVVDPPAMSEWEKPEIYVDFSGPDSALLLDRGGELLRALELLAFEILRLPSGEHEKISFDCKNQRSLRLKELRGKGPANRCSFSLCSHVVAGAPNGSPGAARRSRFAHGK
jgi:predicted RNA-binding protein Jag